MRAATTYFRYAESPLIREKNMTLPREQIEEIELLLKFDLSSAQVGLKVHSNANPEMIAAAQRLYGKGLIDQEDGGFLTPLGHEAAEHLQFVAQILGTSAAG
ncbi:MAG: hypothetical protein ACJAQ8_001609 [Haliea salexigens]